MFWDATQQHKKHIGLQKPLHNKLYNAYNVTNLTTFVLTKLISTILKIDHLKLQLNKKFALRKVPTTRLQI